MIYYGKPGPFDASVEERIHATVTSTNKIAGLNAPAIGDLMRGFATRSIADLNVIAVTTSCDGGEKRKPERILKVYVVPPAVGVGTASATSGTIRDPSGAGLSG